MPVQVLLVEDDTDLNWLLEQALRRAGYATATAANACEALAHIRTRSFAVALIDSNLPDQDGLRLAATIRRESPATAAILLSGQFECGDAAIQAALDDGLLAGFVTKPFRLDDLWHIVEHALAQRKEGCPADGPHPGR